MKIRNGFVSNSSSTSFCLYGVVLEEDENVDYWSLAKNCKYEPGVDTYYDLAVLGLPPNDMRDDETLKEFKERVEAAVRGDLGQMLTELHFGWRTDGGRDG